jgi:hypothetical protein
MQRSGAGVLKMPETAVFMPNIWHLDRTAVVWDALVWGDYEFVMPLPVRKKWGIQYVYQPLFCQQLGIFPKPSNWLRNFFMKRCEKF